MSQLIEDLTGQLRGATTPKGKRMISTRLVNAYIAANEDPAIREKLIDQATLRSGNGWNNRAHDNYRAMR